MKNLNNHVNEKSTALLAFVQCLGLGMLGIMTILALGQEVFSIIAKGSIELGDLLLLFIYLEVLAMVRAQLVSGEIPLSMPFAITMVALSRYLVLDMKAMDSWQILSISGAMLLLAVSLVPIRYWKNARKSNLSNDQAPKS